MPDIKAGSNEAVIFFKGDLVDKEVLYPEFEAVLDGYIGLPGYAGRVVKAVFLQITPRLNIQSAVFFTVPFTDDGQVEASWNIPLQHLADHGLNGPNLGEGVIRLACRSSCPVAWYKDKLW
ncbi:MAG TPA: chromosome partitioning protein ParA, partial [Spongiibacteraceae bacterium]|nr:chromosome partitioning protein ParA [Spongiibacteraceae bacterium]